MCAIKLLNVGKKVHFENNVLPSHRIVLKFLLKYLEKNGFMVTKLFIGVSCLD